MNESLKSIHKVAAVYIGNMCAKNKHKRTGLNRVHSKLKGQNSRTFQGLLKDLSRT